ncbi:MAG: pectinesterase family protein [Bacteroidales bacterium]|nr:hypothetical protein [Bacteroidaceae bacterium]MDO4202375.1 pectinesterase family protein [Bacteroidales bacterium]
MKTSLSVIAFTLMSLLANPAGAQTPDSLGRIRYRYDFVVPDNGNFIAAVHAANNRADKSKRFRIFVKSSMYRIKGEGNPIKITENGKELTIPSPMTILTAPNTSICGEGMKNTQIESMPMHEGISCTSTLFLNGADSTYLQDFELWSNYRDDMTAFASRAVALNEKNCRGNIFKRLSLMSNQDTYYTNDGGSTYLEDCTVKGTVDFICGGGTIYFNRCDIELRERGNKANVICAPATEANRAYGYVFNSCRIYGDKAQEGKYMLGRPWKNAPRAVFIGTLMELLPDSLGWTEMHGTLPRLFSEYESLDNEFQLAPTALRRKQFKDANNVVTNVRFNTNLTTAEAEKYDIHDVFPNWHPEQKAAQIPPPEIHIKDTGSIYWDDVHDACLYAVCRNRDVVAFTTQPYYNVPKGSPQNVSYSIRCANYYGGLGERSNEVTYPNR